MERASLPGKAAEGISKPKMPQKMKMKRPNEIADSVRRLKSMQQSTQLQRQPDVQTCHTPSTTQPITPHTQTCQTRKLPHTPLLPRHSPLPQPAQTCYPQNVPQESFPTQKSPLSPLAQACHPRPPTSLSARHSSLRPVPPSLQACPPPESSTPASNQNYQNIQVPTQPTTAPAYIPTSFPNTPAATPNVARSIRCKSQMNEDELEGPAPKKQRGVVTGKKTEHVFGAEGQIKITFSEFHNGPATKRDRSLMAHDIGSQVKTSVPMMGSNFDEVKKNYPADVQKMYTYLEAHFDLPEANTQLWKFIEKIATKRFSEWKHDCRAHWEQFGDEIPLEFLERPDQWEWLCNHFKDPKQQELSARMKWVRGQKKMNHHSGKLAFSYRAEEHLLKNNPAPFVASFSDAYSRDPVARPYVDQMIERVNMMVEERLAEHPEIPINAPFDTAKQVGVFESIVGERRGTEIRGMGDSMRRKPCPRGGPTHMPYVAILEEKIAVQEEKIAAQEEMLIAQDEEKNEIKSRLADLEEQFRQFFGGGQ